MWSIKPELSKLCGLVSSKILGMGNVTPPTKNPSSSKSTTPNDTNSTRTESNTRYYSYLWAIELTDILDDQPLDLSVQSRVVDARNINGMVRRISGQDRDGHQVQEGSLGSSTGGSEVRRDSALDNYQNKAYWANYHLHQALHKAKVYSQIRRDSKRRNSALGIESVRYS